MHGCGCGCGTHALRHAEQAQLESRELEFRRAGRPPLASLSRLVRGAMASENGMLEEAMEQFPGVSHAFAYGRCVAATLHV